MPALPDVPQVLRLDHFLTVGVDTQALCRLHCTYTGTPPDAGTCVGLAVQLFNHWTLEFPSLMGLDRQITGIGVTDLTSPTSGAGVEIASFAGSRVGTRLPAQTCALVNGHIARRYRGGKPRTYWPFGVAEDLTNDQQWQSGFPTAVTASMTSYNTLISGTVVSGTALGGLVSISYYRGFTPVVNPISGRTRDVPNVRTGTIPVDTIETFSTNPNVSTQRRRTLIRH